MKNSTNIWIAELEYLRGFGIIAVIIIHSTGRLWWFPHMQLPNILAVTTTLINSFSLFAVPLFIFISGFTLSLKYDGNISPITFYKRRAKIIILPYLFFSLLYILFYIIIGDRSFKFVSIIFDLLTANASFHLWFMALIIQFYILYPVLIRIYQHYEDQVLFLLVASLVLQLLIPIINIIVSLYLHDTYPPESKVIKAVDLLFGRLLLTQLFYFIVGVYAGKHYAGLLHKLNKIQPYKLGILFAIACCMSIILSTLWLNKLYTFYHVNAFVYAVLHGLSSILLSLMVIVLLFRSATYLKGTTLYFKNVINSLGKLSFGIYLVHIIFIRIAALGMERFHIRGDDWLFYPLLTGTSLGLSFLSIYFMSKLTFSDVLIGFRRENTSSTTSLG